VSRIGDTKTVFEIVELAQKILYAELERRKKAKEEREAREKRDKENSE